MRLRLCTDALLVSFQPVCVAGNAFWHVQQHDQLPTLPAVWKHLTYTSYTTPTIKTSVLVLFCFLTPKYIRLSQCRTPCSVILFIFVGAGGTRQIETRSAPLPQASQWHEDVLWYGAAASLCSSWHFRWRRPDWKVRAVGWVGGYLADFFTSSVSPSATPPHSLSQSLAPPCDAPRLIRQAVWWSEGTLDYCLNYYYYIFSWNFFYPVPSSLMTVPIGYKYTDFLFSWHISRRKVP